MQHCCSGSWIGVSDVIAGRIIEDSDGWILHILCDIGILLF